MLKTLTEKLNKEQKCASPSKFKYGGHVQYTTNYSQVFAFDNIGNMTRKTSTEATDTGNRVGDSLNYNLEYKYYEETHKGERRGTHKAERIGNRYYSYDLNGNVIAEREGSHATTPEIYRPYYRDGDIYSVDYGFGLVRPEGNTNNNDGVYQRNYRWNERNLLSESSDLANTVHYRYGADGQRALKYVSNTTVSTVYFNKMWQTTNSTTEWLQSKHIYLGEDRVATKFNSEGNPNTLAEERRVYYYHTDHLGSAQTITNYKGDLHERLEYTPYGELWIDWQSNEAIDSTPFRFTGKERDPETGLYYFGARYLDPKTSRWLSADPALTDGSYIPVAPNSDDARKHNENLPGMGGVFNAINLHTCHYSFNNPIRYIDPNGRNGDDPPLQLSDQDREFLEFAGLLDNQFNEFMDYLKQLGIERTELNEMYTFVKIVDSWDELPESVRSYVNTSSFTGSIAANSGVAPGRQVRLPGGYHVTEEFNDYKTSVIYVHHDTNNPADGVSHFLTHLGEYLITLPMVKNFVDNKNNYWSRRNQ
ncbi:MAG: hypothetical protein LBU88_06070 [Treponema sp.]|jgi:RHS repeat-associated protein|nr:hypothetical protein [Treponema sp.]